MKSIVKSFALVLLALVVAAPLSAADKKTKKNAGKKARGNQMVNAALKRLAKAELTDEQVAAIKKLGAEAAPKANAASKKAPITKEQRQARGAARKKGQDEGLKGKALQAAVAAAINLSDEQKAAQAEANAVRAEFNKAATALLSKEQRQKLRGGKKKGGKKKRTKKKVKAE